MLDRHFYTALAAVIALSPVSAAPKSCNGLQPASGVQPVVQAGYTWTLVANGLTSPRSIQVANGSLWVLESGKGVSRHLLADSSCPEIIQSYNVLSDTSLNHGMVVHQGQLYVSSSSVAYQTTLSQNRQSTVPGSARTLVNNMDQSDHVTRTLLMLNNNTLLIARGSDNNIDPGAAFKTSGRSQIRMFNIGNNAAVQDYATSGTILGWGLRNDVGLALHPKTHGLFSVENSADQLVRDGVDVHENNPGEELNYLGVVVPGQMSTFKPHFFGYPQCFTIWNKAGVPDSQNLVVGSPFALNSTGDTYCKTKTFAPRLTFQAHMAPIDIKFEPSGTRAWVSFHGSWDRSPPGKSMSRAICHEANECSAVGYGVAVIDFGADGMPTQPSTSTTAAQFMFSNANVANCPNGCFRPTGLWIDAQNRVWVASDATGEVYVLTPS